jgi:hypothetical protein
MPDTTGHAGVTSGFAELVCAEPAWLRAEFDAIMTANFGVLPPPPGQRPAPAGPRRRKHSPGATTAGGPGRLVDVVPHTRDGQRRQRSPPLVGSAAVSEGCRETGRR